MALNIRDEFGNLIDAAKKKAEEIEAEKEKKKEETKKQEKSNIRSALNKANDGLDDVISKLSLVSNILSEDILINNEGYKCEEIENMKRQIETMND